MLLNASLYYLDIFKPAEGDNNKQTFREEEVPPRGSGIGNARDLTRKRGEVRLKTRGSLHLISRTTTSHIPAGKGSSLFFAEAESGWLCLQDIKGSRAGIFLKAVRD